MTITISDEYALGIIVTIIGATVSFAWYTNGRFTAIETAIEWIKKELGELKDDFKIWQSKFENFQSFNQKSPILTARSSLALTAYGLEILNESGMKEYIDKNKEKFLADCQVKTGSNPYEIQQHIINMFNDYAFEPDFDNAMKNYAFNKGIDTNMIRRTGAFYFRDICLTHFSTVMRKRFKTWAGLW